MVECYQCGTCAASCPVAKVTERFNPRALLQLALLGFVEEVLSGEAIWLRCSCYNCQERCPEMMPLVEIFHDARNMAIKKGYMPDIYSDFQSALMNDARIVKVSKFIEKKRANLGLPPIQPTGVEALRKILSATGFDKLQKKSPITE